MATTVVTETPLESLVTSSSVTSSSSSSSSGASPPSTSASVEPVTTTTPTHKPTAGKIAIYHDRSVITYSKHVKSNIQNEILLDCNVISSSVTVTLYDAVLKQVLSIESTVCTWKDDRVSKPGKRRAGEAPVVVKPACVKRLHFKCPKDAVVEISYHTKSLKWEPNVDMYLVPVLEVTGHDGEMKKEGKGEDKRSPIHASYVAAGVGVGSSDGMSHRATVHFQALLEFKARPFHGECYDDWKGVPVTLHDSEWICYDDVISGHRKNLRQHGRRSIVNVYNDDDANEFKNDNVIFKQYVLPGGLSENLFMDQRAGSSIKTATNAALVKGTMVIGSIVEGISSTEPTFTGTVTPKVDGDRKSHDGGGRHNYQYCTILSEIVPFRMSKVNKANRIKRTRASNRTMIHKIMSSIASIGLLPSTIPWTHPIQVTHQDTHDNHYVTASLAENGFGWKCEINRHCIPNVFLTSTTHVDSNSGEPSFTIKYTNKNNVDIAFDLVIEVYNDTGIEYTWTSTQSDTVFIVGDRIVTASIVLMQTGPSTSAMSDKEDDDNVSGDGQEMTIQARSSTRNEDNNNNRPQRNFVTGRGRGGPPVVRL